MEQRLTIITLGVRNLKQAEDFYLDRLGWTKSAHSTDGITFIELNGILLSLYPREELAEDATINPKGSGFKGFTMSYNARSEQEVDALFAAFEEKSVPIVKRPHKVFWGGYSGYIADLDGNLWEIAYNPFLKMDVNGNVE